MTYLCQRKIRTLADNYVGISNGLPKFTHNGVDYVHWDFTYPDGAIGNEWLATYELEIDSLDKAHKAFRAKLLDAVPKIALISQCYTEFLQQPFMIRNLDKDYAYFFNIFDSTPVSLHFDDDSLKALRKLDEVPISREFLAYWNDATNTTGASPKMLLLFSAIEALCKKKNGKLDKSKRLELLGEELDVKFFESGDRGLRHRLVHGEYFQQSDFDKNYIELIHGKIIGYFNDRILKEELITTDVVNPQRHFDDNKLQGAYFIRNVEDSSSLFLREVLDDYDTEEHKFKGKYEYLFDVSTQDY